MPSLPNANIKVRNFTMSGAPARISNGFCRLESKAARQRGLSLSAAGLTLLVALTGHAQSAFAQNFQGNDPAETRAFAPAANAEAQKMRMFKDADIGTQPTPGIIPAFGLSRDSSGWIA